MKDMQGSYTGRWGLPEHRRPRPDLENRLEMSDHSGDQGAVRSVPMLVPPLPQCGHHPPCPISPCPLA